ncbi:MAG: hypothetical protein ABR517_02035 [Thermoanaerobaculia bacterium]
MKEHLVSLVEPLYDNPEAGTGFDEVERIEVLARRLYEPSAEESQLFELLILFHRLGRWMAHPGNAAIIGRASGGLLAETMVEQLAKSLNRLEAPETNLERVVASAVAIEAAGVRGFFNRAANARRSGRTVEGVAVSEIESPGATPAWMSPEAATMLTARRGRARAAASALLEELELSDAPVSQR